MRRLMICLWLAASLTAKDQKSSLVGSSASQGKQNKEADREALTRIENDKQLETFESEKRLVHLPQTAGIRIKEDIAENLQFCRPWTAVFLSDTGKAYAEAFKDSFQINSAVRTIADQIALGKHNKNAAPAKGDHMSSHPTGSTIDIGKRDMSRKELKWFRAWLKELEGKGLIEATEEHSQPCFHVMVFKQYATAPRPKPKTAMPKIKTRQPKRLAPIF